MSPKSVVFFTPSWYPWDANFYLFSATADPMLAEASIPTAHGSSHSLVPHVQHSGNYSSPDIHTYHHSAPSIISRDEPDLQSCLCLLVWNSVKDYWERLYGRISRYSITKLLIGYLASLVPRVLELYFRGRKVLRALFSIHLHFGRLCGSDASNLLRCKTPGGH